jgi:hypothetical protein
LALYIASRHGELHALTCHGCDHSAATAAAAAPLIIRAISASSPQHTRSQKWRIKYRSPIANKTSLAFLAHPLTGSRNVLFSITIAKSRSISHFALSISPFHFHYPCIWPAKVLIETLEMDHSEFQNISSKISDISS